MKRTDWEYYLRNKARKATSFHIRGLNTANRDAFKEYCRRHGYTIRDAVACLVGEAVRKRRLCIHGFTGLGGRASLNCRHINPDVMARFKGHCIIYGYKMCNAIEYFMRDAVSRDRRLPIRGLPSTFT